MFLPGREFDLQVDSLRDDRVGSSIEESKSDRRYRGCSEFVSSGESGVDKTMSWAGVDQSLEGVVGDGIGD
jgi:hypothetical protein